MWIAYFLLSMSAVLLTACLCGAAAAKGNMGYVDDAAQQNLIVANTEAPGADVMVSLSIALSLSCLLRLDF